MGGRIASNASSHRCRILAVTILLFPFLVDLVSPRPLVSGRIVGTVKDAASDKSLAGANVVLQGTKLGTAAGFDGSFRIARVPPGTYSVIATFVGYHKQSVSIQVLADEVAKIDFELRQDFFRGEEVIVTGIASRTSRANSPVSVSRIQVNDFTKTNSYQNLTQLVNGKLAGVSVQPSSGNVASGFRFNVRSGTGLTGSGQPVIYLDGARIESSDYFGFGVGGQGTSLLADLNPEEIETIEVLKGPAAAASYGTSGANGVVLITTKHGRPSEDTGVAIDYKLVLGVNQQSYHYRESEMISARAANQVFSSGNIVQNSLSASGGTQLLRYFTSFDSRVEQGIFRQSRMNRKSLRANLTAVPNKKLTFRVNTNHTYNRTNRPHNDNSAKGLLANTVLAPQPYNFTDSTAIANIHSEVRSNHFIGSAQAQYLPLTTLTTRIAVGIDENSIEHEAFFPVEFDYSPDARLDAGFRSVRAQHITLFTYSIDAAYRLALGSDWRISGVVGSQLFDRRLRSTATEKFDFLTSLVHALGAGRQLAGVSEGFEHRREAGIFAEAGLAFRDQYFFSARLRRDWATAIGRQAATIAYPGMSLAVRLDKYDWLPRTFGLLKTRVAYGETGILPDLRDAIPVLWGPEEGGEGVGAVISQIGNRAIKPERVKEIEIGLDAEFQNKYAIELTYYHQKVSDALIRFRDAPSTGKVAGLPPINIGQAHGSGFELLLHAAPVESRKVDLNMTLTGSWRSNEVDALGGAQPLFDGNNINVIKDGLPKHEFYKQVVEGALFNEDGTYAGPRISETRVALGNPIPGHHGSFALNLRLLNNLGLYVLTDWATGHKVFNRTRRFRAIFGGDSEHNRLGTQIGLYQEGNSKFVENVESLAPGTSEYEAAATRFARLETSSNINSNWIEPADFFKLRELSLNYRFHDLLPKLGLANFLKDLQVTFSGRNLWTISRYSGPDPEVNFNGSFGAIQGQDFMTSQHPRVYNLAFRFSL